MIARPAVDVPASAAGAVAALFTAVAIYLGSGALRRFDAALIGYGRMERNGGVALIESEPGRGTEVRLRIPRARA